MGRLLVYLDCGRPISASSENRAREFPTGPMISESAPAAENICRRAVGDRRAPRLRGMTAEASDGRARRAAETHHLPAVVRALRDRLAPAQLRAAAILAGGAAGALTRAGVGRAFPVQAGAWPWATFAVNVAGAFVLAWATTRLAEMVAPTRYWRPLVGTGFCGALTTFSTFQVETIRLARDGHEALGLAYASVSMTVGLGAAIAATVVARRHRYG
jgi:fluoride exporter